MVQKGGQTDKEQMDGWIENLPILQDFVPYWAMKTKKVEQGKGTADHLIPLGDWFKNNMKKCHHLSPYLTQSYKNKDASM